MPIGQVNLEHIASNFTRNVFIGNVAVGSGATTTTIPLTLYNPAGKAVSFSANVQQRLIGSVLEFLTGINQGILAEITGATANSVTIESGVIATPPAQGDRVVILHSVNITVSAPENMAQWDGTAVAAPLDDNSDGVAATTGGLPRFLARLTGWTGSAWSRLKLAASGSLQTRDDATGATNTVPPTSAVQVAGFDGNYLRVLSTDGAGVLGVNIRNSYATLTVDVNNTVSAAVEGTVSLVSSTTTPLAANGSVTLSGQQNTPGYARIVGSVYSDQSGTLYVQQSPDNTNWDVTSTFSVTGGTGLGFSVQTVATYWRLYYVNGATAQTVFRLYGYLSAL